MTQTGGRARQSMRRLGDGLVTTSLLLGCIATARGAPLRVARLDVSNRVLMILVGRALSSLLREQIARAAVGRRSSTRGSAPMTVGPSTLRVGAPAVDPKLNTCGTTPGRRGAGTLGSHLTPDGPGAGVRVATHAVTDRLMHPGARISVVVVRSTSARALAA